MALLDVGYTADGLVVVTVTDGDVVTQIPMLPQDAQQLAKNLMMNASQADTVRPPTLVKLPDGIKLPPGLGRQTR